MYAYTYECIHGCAIDRPQAHAGPSDLKHTHVCMSPIIHALLAVSIPDFTVHLFPPEHDNGCFINMARYASSLHIVGSCNVIRRPLLYGHVTTKAITETFSSSANQYLLGWNMVEPPLIKQL